MRIHDQILARVKDSDSERKALDALRIKQQLSTLRAYTKQIETLICTIHPDHVSEPGSRDTLVRIQRAIHQRQYLNHTTEFPDSPLVLRWDSDLDILVPTDEDPDDVMDRMDGEGKGFLHTS